MKLYIVVTAQSNGAMRAEACYTERRLAENYIELDRLKYATFAYSIVEGEAEKIDAPEASNG